MTNPRARWEAARGKWRIRAVRGGKWFRERGKKGISMLPHLFTLLNLAFGVFSILLTFADQVPDNIRWAALAVGASLLADGLDGRMARLIKADGEFGKELDSLADVVSFGVAPALLAYRTTLEQMGPYGLAVLAVFPICGALRLARFNIIKTSGFFIGLPITAAGTLLAALIFFYRHNAAVLEGLWLPGATLILAYLMVCTIPYPDFKKFRSTRFRVVDWLGPAALVAFSLATDPGTIVFLPLLVYALLGPYLYLLRKAGDRVARLREAGSR